MAKSNLTSWTVICPDCEEPVKIINDDFDHSMMLHKKSHLLLKVDCKHEKAENTLKLNNQVREDSKEEFETINNDTSYSSQLHSENQESPTTDILFNTSSSGVNNNISVKEEKQFPSINWDLSVTAEICDIIAVYNELLRTNAVIGLNARYLEREGNVYVCKLCNTNPIKVDNVAHLEGSIMVHIIGLKHNEKLDFEEAEVIVNMLHKAQFSMKEISESLKFLKEEKGVISCILCEYTIPSNNTNDSLIESLSVHLRGPEHISNEEEESQRILHPKHLVEKLFQKLPIKHQEDIEFILVTPFKHLLLCKLCNTTIHTRYLKEHLEGLTHVQEKELNKRPNLLIKSEHFVTDKNVLKHMLTLSSLLQNIELKSPW